jgi:hypothetical protein
LLRRTCFLLFLLHLLPACTTKVDGLMVSDAMTYDALAEREIVAGGVVNASGDIDMGESNSWAQQMKSRIKDQRKGIGVLDVSAVTAKMGAEKYKAMLVAYQKNASLSPEQMEAVKKAVGGPKFFALARINRNTLHKSSHETSGSEYKDNDGKKKYRPGEVVRSHRREMSVTMHVYDLSRKELAFTGSVTKSEENTSRYEKNLVSGVVSIINASRGESQDSTYPWPTPPAESNVLDPIFKGFAQNFPKKK